MKKLFFLFTMAVFIFSGIPAQSQTIIPVKKNNVVFPSIDILALDSSTIIQTKKIIKNKPVILLFFNTTCEHCQKEAEDIVTNRKKFNKIQIVMISTENITAIKNFYKQYTLSKIANIIIGRDYKNAGATYYMFESYPYCAIYSRRHKHIRSFERNFNAENILQELKKSGEL